jgi:hypothetical protein
MSATSLQVVEPSKSARMNALVPSSMSEAMALADVMSKADLLPEHLRGKPGDCLLVIMQAQRWNMDPVSVAQCTSVVRGKLCYEGKLVAAALYAAGAIDGRLRYEFSGAGEQRAVRVIGRPRGTGADQEVTGTVANWKTDNGNWKKSPDDMLVYRGTRQWARRYAPDAMMGVYTPDEFEDAETARATVTVVASQDAAHHGMPTDYPAEDFARNLPTWRKVIEEGRRSAADIIAMAETKGALSAEQQDAIRACEVTDAEVSE